MQFSIVATYAFLGFAITVGLLVGGAWSALVRALREPTAVY